jgi:hypothetical protein
VKDHQGAMAIPASLDSFVHIPKTGGSTLRSVLARQYGIGSIVYCEPSSPRWPKGETVLSFLTAALQKQDVKLITGHYPIGVHEFVRRPVRYFSMMRDPLDRELSNYYYAFAYKSHFLGDAIRSGEMPFEAFLARHAHDASAPQAHLLAGQYPCRGDALEAASFNIGKGLVAFGVAERFDESLLFFAKQLGWRPPLYLRRNVTRLDDERQAKRNDTVLSAKESARKYLKTDYALYGLAETMLDDFIAGAGPAFESAIAAYHEIQADLAKHEGKDIYREYSFNDDAPLPAGTERHFDSEPYKKLVAFLAEPLARPSAPRNFAGYVERAEGNMVAGWAIDLWSDRPISVDISYKGQKLATALCDREREDVSKVGYGTSKVGFRVEVEPGIPAEEVKVSFADSPILLRGNKK